MLSAIRGAATVKTPSGGRSGFSLEKLNDGNINNTLLFI